MAIKTLLQFLSILLAFGAIAQQPSALQVEGSGWRCVGVFIDNNGFPCGMDGYTFTFNGDTVCNNTVYHKYYFDRHTMTSIISDDVYAGALRTEGEKVYYLLKDSTSEVLIFDYELTIGDTLRQGCAPKIYYIIHDTTTVTMDDGSHRKKYYAWKFNDLYFLQYTYMIYGIGLKEGLLPPDMYIQTTYNGGVSFQTYCEDGIKLYHNPGFGAGITEDCDFPLDLSNIQQILSCVIFPNPVTTGTFFIKYSQYQHPSEIQNVQITDVLGRPILEKSNEVDYENGVNVSGFRSGIYYVRIQTSSETITAEKIVIINE